MLSVSSALDEPKWGAVKDFSWVRSHQINLEPFSQRHLQQLFHKTLHVGDFTLVLVHIHDVIWLRDVSVKDSQSSVALLVVLVLREFIRSWHPFQLQPVLPGVAWMRATVTLGWSVGEALTEQSQEGSPSTKEVDREGSYGACTELVVFWPMPQVKVEDADLEWEDRICWLHTKNRSFHVSECVNRCTHTSSAQILFIHQTLAQKGLLRPVFLELLNLPTGQSLQWNQADIHVFFVLNQIEI